jgi:chaperonin GroES
MRECQLGGPIGLVSDVEANDSQARLDPGRAPMNLTPLGDRVIVKAVEQDKVSPGGIVLPETTKDRPQRGTVLAVGPGRWGEDGARVPLGVGVGDEVIYARYGGTELDLEGENTLILQEQDILATVTPNGGPAKTPRARRATAKR